MIAPFKTRKKSQPDPFITLRGTVEAACAAPAIVLISSVAMNDGKTRVTNGIATALAKSGSSTLTVDGSKLCKQSRAELLRMFEDLRGRHDYIIIDGPTLAEGGLALASIADGTLIAVRSTRRVVDADAEAALALERFHANVIGVVETTGEYTGALEAPEVASIPRSARAESLAS